MPLKVSTIYLYKSRNRHQLFNKIVRRNSLPPHPFLTLQLVLEERSQMMEREREGDNFSCTSIILVVNHLHHI